MCGGAPVEAMAKGIPGLVPGPDPALKAADFARPGDHPRASLTNMSIWRYDWPRTPILWPRAEAAPWHRGETMGSHRRPYLY